ncbi:hypothetical protein HAT86_03340 [Roseovarius gahaiensis]|uniref:Uncharacterized protein n=1 Tax=Roseovarius gahaiensis TaxID=2716691 RepID=A0A967EF76_9RHOB|nr:hypothetical protein [Roseovarius gahaiensis]NHQ73501.1 hypothetical protein [Roseovarius gahaiensis]
MRGNQSVKTIKVVWFGKGQMRQWETILVIGLTGLTVKRGAGNVHHSSGGVGAVLPLAAETG